jgi:hypothetical protein
MLHEIIWRNFLGVASGAIGIDLITIAVRERYFANFELRGLNFGDV